MSFKFSDALIQEIIEKNDIVSVIQEYTKLQKRGGSYKGLCPFHKEKTPSFSVQEDKEIFKCFGCGKGGNVVHFIMLVENLDFISALRFLADKSGINIPDTYDQKDELSAKLRQDIISVNKEAALFFHEKLSRSKLAYEYITKRGISDKFIKSFGLGYAGDEWTSLIEHFKKNGISEDLLLKAGLVLPKKNGEYYDRFRNRIIFPIFDVVGNVIAFGGRVLDDSLPKYLNSPETNVYTKGKHLYGLNFARKSDSKRVIIVEGYMDCLALHLKGITWSVASLGTALTESQGKLLKKYFDEIIISYDADSAGQAATLRGLDILNELGCRVKVISIPDGKDPDEFLKRHTAEEFILLVDEAKSLVEYKVNIAKGKWNPTNMDTRVEFLKEITLILSRIFNHVERDMYINWISREYDISRDALADSVDELRKFGKISNPSNFINKKLTYGNKEKEEVAPAKENKNLDRDEKILLLLIADDITCLKKLSSEIKPDFFIIRENRELADVLWDRVESGLQSSKEIILSHASLDDASIIAGLIENWFTPTDCFIACKEIIKKLKNAKIQQRQEKIYVLLQNSQNMDEIQIHSLKEELSIILKEKRAVLWIIR